MNRVRTIFACSYDNCSSVFRKRLHYECHLRMHNDERPFICSYDNCDKSYRRLAHLQRHQETHEANFRCSFPSCDKILKTRACLRKHIDSVHGKREPKEYKCSECDQIFNKHNMLQAHTYTHTGKMPHQCLEPNCDRSFFMPSQLKRHMKRHRGYTCESADCLKKFPRWSLLLAHRKECHPKIFKCSVCNKEFNFACNLKAHSITHKDEREVFRCSVPKCIRFYQAKRHLSDHLRYFHEIRPFSCPNKMCSRFFKSEEEMKTHIIRQHVPKTRKRKNKPDFPCILAGFTKGTMKDLNPQCSSTISKESDVNSKIASEVGDHEENSSKSDATDQEIGLKIINDRSNLTSSTDKINLENSVENTINNENLNYCGTFVNNHWNTFEIITSQVI